MIDFGFDKIALIGAVALVVIGPEKLPRVARTMGALFGKAQRYVNEVKAEVNRSIELEELKKVKTQFEDAARDVRSSVDRIDSEVRSAGAVFQSDWNSTFAEPAAADPATTATVFNTDGTVAAIDPPAPVYRHPKKNWRLKRGATPQWYKQRNGIRTKALSGAARVARFRPKGAAR